PSNRVPGGRRCGAHRYPGRHRRPAPAARARAAVQHGGPTPASPHRRARRPAGRRAAPGSMGERAPTVSGSHRRSALLPGRRRRHSMTQPPRLSIAMVGTRGVPARYGGFETCVEEVGRRLAARGHRVVVYCRQTAGEEPQLRRHEGMDLVHLPALPRRSLETLSHTALSVAHLARHRTDVALVFNAANAPTLPLVRARGIPVATHVDGLEWLRSKWGSVGKRYYRAAEALAVRWSDAVIAD